MYPNVGAAGAVVGGAYGRGVVFEKGRPVGFTELNQGAAGAIIGGQTYSRMIVFENEAALGRLGAAAGMRKENNLYSPGGPRFYCRDE